MVQFIVFAANFADMGLTERAQNCNLWCANLMRSEAFGQSESVLRAPNAEDKLSRD
jgi:hypothetical protein